MKTILVVEDNIHTNKVIYEFLKDAGYNVLCAFDGEQGLELFFNNKVDLCILDVMLPKLSGTDILARIRKHRNTAIIMLTALDDEPTQIKSFNLSADEYVTKPFSPLVLVMRVQALLRRIYPETDKIINISGVAEINFSAHKVHVNGKNIDFTSKELEILKLLIDNKGKVLSRSQILDSIWGLNAASIDRTIDTHIKNIRKKLTVKCITTVKGAGYRFEEDTL